MSVRADLLVCVAATTLLAGSGAIFRARLADPAPATTPDAVLTVLPPKAAVPSAADPLARARAHLQRARQADDPREESYAEAALAPLFAQGNDPPAAAWFLRGVLAQRRHAFVPAAEDLQHALQKEPALVDARLTLAFVDLAQGEPRQAERTCEALQPHAPEHVYDACIAASWTRAGRAEAALQRLQRWLAGAGDLRADEQAWLWSLAADAAEASGQPAAEAHWHKSLALDPNDRFTRLALADWLLDNGRGGEVPALLAGAGLETDALLLRRALATGDADAVATLRARFAAMTERGDPLHLREEIRLRAAFDRPAEADLLLDLARRNFAVQREVWDLRVLLEACVRAAHQEPCAAALHDPLTSQHARLRPLAAQLAEVRP